MIGTYERRSRITSRPTIPFHESSIDLRYIRQAGGNSWEALVFRSEEKLSFIPSYSEYMLGLLLAFPGPCSPLYQNSEAGPQRKQ